MHSYLNLLSFSRSVVLLQAPACGDIFHSLSVFGVPTPSEFELLYLATKMSGSMTARAERNEILFGIAPRQFARVEVVDLEASQFGYRSARIPLAKRS